MADDFIFAEVDIFYQTAIFYCCVISLQNHLSVVHHTEPVHELCEKFEVMFYDDDNLSSSDDFVEKLNYLSFQLRRDTSRRFVE